jgi:hypothetical protein
MLLFFEDDVRDGRCCGKTKPLIITISNIHNHGDAVRMTVTMTARGRKSVFFLVVVRLVDALVTE